MQAACLTDEELITRVQQGNEEMLEVLIRRYYDEVYYFCCYKTGDAESSYDCTQETFLKVTRNIHRYAEKSRFKGWLFSIARNVCNDFFRGKPKEVPDTESLMEIPEQKNRIAGSEIALDIREALKLLTEEQREVVILRFYCDFKVREIAKIVGVPLPTAKSRLKRGIARLKEILE